MQPPVTDNNCHNAVKNSWALLHTNTRPLPRKPWPSPMPGHTRNTHKRRPPPSQTLHHTTHPPIHLPTPPPSCCLRWGFFLTSEPTSTVLASISCRARTDRDCSRMRQQIARSGGTFCRRGDKTEGELVLLSGGVQRSLNASGKAQNDCLALLAFGRHAKGNRCSQWKPPMGLPKMG